MTAQQLKNSILQMAVQGKLVPQDPNDEPARVLLDRIRTEKEKLIKEGKIKKEKNPSVIFRGEDNLPYEKIDGETHCLSDFAPFDIPNSWEWCRVGDLFTNMSGLAYKKDSLNVKSKDMVRVLRGGNIGDEVFYFKEDDVMISSEFVKSELYLKKNYMITPAVSSLEHIGKIALIDNDYSDVVVGGFVLMLIPYFSNDELSQYLLYAFDAKNHRDNCRNITHKSGQAFYNLSRERLMNLPIPLPPTAEIKRINEQLKRTLPYVSEYATIDDKINTLNSSFPEILKKSILQQAVMGKLVPQDDNDEPASVLLDRIRVEKQALIKAGRLKKDKHESIIYRRDNSHYEKLDGIERCIDDEIPFDLPESWAWSRFSTLCNTLTCGYASTPEYVSEDIGKPFISAKNVKPFHFMPDDHKYIRRELFETLRDGCCPRKGDILLTRVGAGIGEAAIIDSDLEFAIYVSLTLIKLANYELLNNKYILYWLNSPISILAAASNTYGKGASQGNLNVKNVRNYLVPLPPTKEQTRIVAKIDQLMLGCNKL